MSMSKLIAAGASALAVAVVVGQTARLSQASENRRSTEAGLKAATADAAELSRLRAQSAARIFGEPPEDGFIEAVNSALAAAGLPTRLAHGITKEAGRTNGDSTVRVQDMRIDLQPITVAQLGSFLQGWDTDQPAWRVTAISISKMTGRQADDQAYRVLLTCSAEYAVTEAP